MVSTMTKDDSSDSVLSLVIFLLLWFISNDFLFTVFHTLFHEISWLYKFAHKEHHTWKAPFVWMSHAMSFTELTANGIAVMFWPVVNAVLIGNRTPLELVWFVQLLSQWFGCCEHSGYGEICAVTIPGAYLVTQHIPDSCFLSWLFSTTKHHDDHHRYFQGNYGGYIAIWDVLMGTRIREGETSYRKKECQKEK